MQYTHNYSLKASKFNKILVRQYEISIFWEVSTKRGMYHATLLVITPITYNLRQAEIINRPTFCSILDMLICLCATNTQKLVLCNLSMHNSCCDNRSFTLLFLFGDQILTQCITITIYRRRSVWIVDWWAYSSCSMGPGEDCRRTTTSFFQNASYLANAGSYLTKQHGLCKIGQWHSHHTIPLYKPSAGDNNTVWRNMPTLGIFFFEKLKNIVILII